MFQEQTTGYNFHHWFSIACIIYVQQAPKYWNAKVIHYVLNYVRDMYHKLFWKSGSLKFLQIFFTKSLSFLPTKRKCKVPKS